MDNNMKELSPDKFHLQAKMQEWLEANQEIYTDFKSKIQSILKNLLCDNGRVNQRVQHYEIFLKKTSLGVRK